MRSHITKLLVCGSILVSVLNFAEANLQNLEVGMPRDKVIELLGEPSGRGSDGRREILFYGVDQEVHLEDGVVHLVTGADGVILERAATVTAQPAYAEALSSSDSVQIWTESSFSGPSFAFHMDEDAPPWALPALLAVFVFFMVLSIAEMWCIFRKAGWPGWTCLIPLYNAYVMVRIAGKPGWWLLLMMVPFVNFVIVLILPFALAERFGRGAGFGLGLLVFPILFYPILAFGSSEYQPLYS